MSLLGRPSFDNRSVLSRTEAKEVYDHFATVGHAGGKDASSGYGGPAVVALLKMAKFETAKRVVDYGCGQGKLAELVLKDIISKKKERNNQEQGHVHWHGVDQSPKMIEKFRERCVDQFSGQDCCSCSVDFLESGDPSDLNVKNSSVDRFVSTYCLDLLSEKDIYEVLDKAEKCLDPNNGLLLLAGITWGYRRSIKTFLMTMVWEILYIVRRKKVGGCRPQALMPYLKARGWRVQDLEETMPNGFPWMVSEVISARPPLPVEQ